MQVNDTKCCCHADQRCDGCPAHGAYDGSTDAARPALTGAGIMQRMDDTRAIIDDWIDEIELLTSDDPDDEAVEELTVELFAEPVILLFGELAR